MPSVLVVRPKNRRRSAAARVGRYFERKPSLATRRDDQAPPAIRRVGLAMAPSTEGHQLVEIEVGAPLGPLYQVVHIKPAPGSAGLTAPARADQNRGLDGLPDLAPSRVALRERDPRSPAGLVRAKPAPGGVGAKQYRGGHLSLLDLVQEGNMDS